jgi:hypothetical protein
VNASGHSDVCVCVTAKPRGLQRSGVSGVILGHPVSPVHAGYLGVGGLLPEGGGAPRRGVLSSGVDRLSGPVRGPSAALLPSRRCGRAYTGGVRVHLRVPVQQGRDLLHNQRTPASSGAARALRICKTCILITCAGILYIAVSPSAFSSFTAEGGFLRHRDLIKI